MNQKRTERRSLLVSILANFIFTVAGLGIFLVTGITALFLDAFFSCIAFVSSIIAFVISHLSRRKTEHYPDGLHFLEPLYGIFKSLLTLFLLVMSVLSTAGTAWTYFSTGGGEPMNVGPVLPYAVTLCVLCFSLGFFNKHQNEKIHGTSTMLNAESKTNFVDGLQSLGIGFAVLLLSFVDINGPLGFLHYTGDFFITTILVLFSFWEPLQVLVASFYEITGGTITNNGMQKFILSKVRTCCGQNVLEKDCRINKMGMYISVHIDAKSLEEHGDETLARVKERLLSELHTHYDNVSVVFCRS